MAVPRSKTSKARTSRRQKLNMALTEKCLIACPNCGNQVLRHRVCPRCGFYRGKQIIVPS